VSPSLYHCVHLARRPSSRECYELGRGCLASVEPGSTPWHVPVDSDKTSLCLGLLSCRPSKGIKHLCQGTHRMSSAAKLFGCKNRFLSAIYLPMNCVLSLCKAHDTDVDFEVVD
jgi:hypothetical protein